MARKPVPRQLPTLAALHPRFHGFRATEHNLAALTHLLRRTVDRVRAAETRHFYSQWEVARFFGVSRRTAQLAYKQLEREGLLTCVRGSATHLHGRKPQPRYPPRAVVGLPAWLRGFYSFPDWRRFHIALEEQLRRHNFVADFVFYHGAEVGLPDFAERLLAHHLDVVIWLYPTPGFLQNLHLLADRGVRVIGIADTPQLFPFQQYLLGNERAYARAIHAWARAGVRAVTVLRSQESRTWSINRRIQECLEHAGLSCSLACLSDTHAESDLAALAQDRSRGVFRDEDMLCVELCRTASQALLELFRRARVLVTRPVNLPADLLRGVHFDLLHYDWARIARRVADDLAAGATPDPQHSTRFEARWLPQVDASAFAQEF